VIERAARVALATVFVYAGALKALDPAAFAQAVFHYRLLPYPAAAALALYLPWLEMVCGLGVIWAATRLGALNLLVGMSLMFVAALLSALWRHLDIACGCFGLSAGGPTALAVSLIRSLALVLVSGCLLWRELRPPASRGASPP
jgi:uncharacterized membrane protein YphA (DoxX/SURF4 family)